MSRHLHRLLPTGSWVRLAIAPALVFIALAIDRQYLMDFYHHLARGRAMVEQGRLIDKDLFTYTVAGQPFQDVNWLTQLGYYTLHQCGGLSLVQLVNALVLALTMVLLVHFCRRVSGSLGTATVVGVFTFFGIWQTLTIRPQTLSLLLFVVLYDLLDRAERRRVLLLVPPLLLALWANLHGAFPAGLMLIGCFLLASAWRAWRHGSGLLRDRPTWALALCLAGSTAATLANPYGWNIYGYVGLTSNRAATRGIIEWLPPNLHMIPIGTVWALSMGLMLLLFLMAGRRLGCRPSPREVCLTVCFLPLACGSVRMVPWWLIAMAPVAAGLLASLLPRRAAADDDRPSWAAGLVFGLILMATVLSAPGLERYNPLLGFAPRERQIEKDLEQARRYLTAHADAGRVFSRFEWGEYLSWTLPRDFKVFMDGRIEIYPDDVWSQYLTLTCGDEGWQKILDDYRVDYLVLDRDYHNENGLLPRVQESAQWRQVLQAGDGVLLYERRPALHAAWAPRP